MENPNTSMASKRKIRFKVANMRMAACVVHALFDCNAENITFGWTPKEEVSVSYLADEEMDIIIKRKMLELFRTVTQTEK